VPAAACAAKPLSGSMWKSRWPSVRMIRQPPAYVPSPIARAAATFTQLAVFAYQAGETRKGDLAKNKALELTPKDMREALKGQLESAKQSAASAAAQPSATP